MKEIGYLKKSAGVYFLFDEEKTLIYIGKSLDDLYSRLKNQCKNFNVSYF